MKLKIKIIFNLSYIFYEDNLYSFLRFYTTWLSTSRGLLSGKIARLFNIGGELLFFVYF